jgi:hypothetical protein
LRDEEMKQDEQRTLNFFEREEEQKAQKEQRED